MLNSQWLKGLTCFLVLASQLRPSYACVMPLPPPVEVETEYEVEVHSLGLNAGTGKLEYLVGIEVELYQSNEPAKCSCLLNLGDTNIPLPPSVVISQATIRVADSLTGEILGNEDEFEFEDDDELETEIEGELPAGSQSYGFAVDVNAVQSLPLGVEDVHQLLFLLEVAPNDLAALQNVPINFAAGSDMPGHPLQLLSGYKTILTFPPAKGDYVWDGAGDGDWTDGRWGLGDQYPQVDAKASINTDVITVTGSQIADKTTVTSGELRVDGSLTSELRIDANGTLSGEGQIVGEVASDGVIAPRGRLSMDGDVEIAKRAALRIVMGANESAAELQVTGKATLEGVLELVDVDPFPTDGVRGDQLTVTAISASRISGAFTRIELNGQVLNKTVVLNSGFRSHVGDGRFYTLGISGTSIDITRFDALQGDADGDGLFTSSDLIRVFQAGQYEDNVPGNSHWMTGDWNGDSDFTTTDLVAAFQTGAYDAAATQVPEPVSSLLLAFGSIALLALRRRSA